MENNYFQISGALGDIPFNVTNNDFELGVVQSTPKNGLGIKQSTPKTGLAITQSTPNNYELRIRELRPNSGLYLSGSLRSRFMIEAALETPQKSVICSPMSALIPLGKLALGAASGTLQELLAAVGLSQRSQLSSKYKSLVSALKKLPGVVLDVASKIYVNMNSQLNKKFKEEAKRVFQSAAEKINLDAPGQAVHTINSWVEKQTRNKIRNILRPHQIPKGASVVLVNAVYFRGEWVQPFESATLGDFYSVSGTQKVPMMSQKSYYNYAKSEVLDSQLIEIPYKGGKVSFVIVLPKLRDGLPVLLRALKLTPEALDLALREMKLQFISLKFPKFKTESELDLTSLYKKIGVNKIFTSGLTEMVKGQTVVVSTAVQKAFIEVTETGTTAAAATMVAVMLASPAFPMKFVADRPFLYLIKAGREQLFAGVFVRQ